MASRSYVVNTGANYLKVSDDQGLTWQTIVPVGYPNINSVTGVYSDPYNPYNVIVTASNGEGLWVSTDGGASFTQSPTTVGIDFICVYYLDSNTILAGGSQLFRSNDGGATWTPTGVSANSLYGSLTVNISSIDFGTYSTGFLSIKDKVYKSYDSGVTWAVVNSDLPVSSGYDIINVGYLNDSNILNVLCTDGVYLSTDGGISFTQTLSILTGTTASRLFRSRELSLFAVITSSQDIYTSNGLTWTLVGNYPNGSAAYQSLFAFDNFNYIFLGTGVALGATTGIYTSSDGGTTLNSEEDYLGRPKSLASTYDYVCGECPSKSEFNPQTGLCDLISYGGPLCPEGYSYDPLTNTCVGETTYYPKDIVIARDNSGSITGNPVTGPFCDLAPTTQTEWNQMTIMQDDIITGISAEITAGTIQVSVVDWSTSAILTQPLTSVLVDVQSAVCAQRTSSGGTNTVGGLCTAYNELKFGATQVSTAEKIIILFTDGIGGSGFCVVNNVFYNVAAGNIPQLRQLATAIKNDGVKIILVALGDSSSEITTIENSYVYVADPVPSLDSNGDLLYFNATFSTAGDIVTSIINGLTTTEFIPTPQCPEGCSVYVDPETNFVYCQCTEEYAIVPCCYELTDCNGSVESIFTQTDLSDYLDANQIIQIEGSDVCWEITLLDTLCTSTQDVIVSGAFAGCEECGPKHGLYNCKDQNTVIYTQTDLSLYVGQTIQIDEYPGECWQVGPLLPSEETAVPVTFTEAFETCLECDPTKYQLTNCLNDEAVIISDSDLSDYLNATINVEGIPGICFSVSAVKCDCIKVTTNVDEYIVTSTTDMNGRKQYFIDLGAETVTLAWDSADQQWKIFNPDTDTLYAYTTLNITCPFTSYWVLTEDAPFTNIVVSYCVSELTSAVVSQSFTGCEPCINC